MKYSSSGLGLIAITVLLVVVAAVMICGVYFLNAFEAKGGSLSTTSGPCSALGVAISPQTESENNLSSFPVKSLCVVNPQNAGVISGFVYVASTHSEQVQGFQDVQSFGNCNGNATESEPCIGMIFATSSAQNLCFWMHNTLIPLQQVWVSSSSIVVDIHEATPNSNSEVCHSAQFVFETFPSAQISIGDRVAVDNLTR